MLKIEERNLPGELTILPMIESGFRTHAKSCAGAVGIWQIMPETGKYLGLEKDSWYDGYKDFIISTKVTINYLEYLNNKFENDWSLSINTKGYALLFVMLIAPNPVPIFDKLI